VSADPAGGEPRGQAPELLAQAAAAGVHRLAIPTPFQVGRVNAYLIEDSPLTLIDSGPNSAKALDELERALAAFAQGVRPQYTQSVINIPHFRSQLLLVITQNLLSIERNVAWLPAVIIPEYCH